MRQQRVEHVKATTQPRRMGKAEHLRRLYREVRRRLIADGKIADPSQKPPKYQYHWTIGDRNQGGIVLANGGGEARGLIKKELGIKKGRLPGVIKIVRKPNGPA